jgi:hypothetical protein
MEENKGIIEEKRLSSITSFYPGGKSRKKLPIPRMFSILNVSATIWNIL